MVHNLKTIRKGLRVDIHHKNPGIGIMDYHDVPVISYPRISIISLPDDGIPYFGLYRIKTTGVNANYDGSSSAVITYLTTYHQI